MSKLVFVVTGSSGIVGVGGFVAYQNGLFSSTNKTETLTVKTRLIKEGYELVSSDEKFQEFFKEFKTNEEFVKELNKHRRDGENLESDNGDKGKVALKALCSSYFDSKDSLDKAIKWCVLRIKDKKPNEKAWISDDGGSDGADWKSAFNKSKNEMINQKISGVDGSTNDDKGKDAIKQWCTENKKLPINTKNNQTQNNVVSWCTK
ncbi:hypothetical protein MHC_01530 [Mycoplasma haemocanis str. Illinois]|uniref:Uncharacterized protein n=1 Tax=Mycoplasma haemocanis (strain Illinois) TaxID=1111676 RepID=H6N6A0_MYCHN|nr:hypothetical protein [Mycoplasma haemocanis]AEW45172.1 hypothetical protein MHC_01530 [Mycoplasma haemocanis str. Illinois]